MLKVAENIILRTVKTAVKPKIKLTVRATGLGLPVSPDDTGEPPMTHNHDGISGSTQGEKNDSNPAPNAIKMDKFSLILN